MSHIPNVTKWSGILRRVTIAAMILLPAAIVTGLLIVPVTPETLRAHFSGVDVSANATWGQMWGVVILNLFNPLILLLTLNEMRKLFSFYQQGQVLTDGCARLIQRIGLGFLAMALMSLLLQPVQTLLLTWANPPGQRAVAIGISSEMLFFAIAGSLMIVIGWAMREAAEVANENRSFV